MNSLTGRLGRHIRNTTVAGLFVLVPVVLTYMVLSFLFKAIDGVLQPAIRGISDRQVTGLGIVLLLALMYAFGLLGRSFIGRRIIEYAQSLLLRLPVVGVVYSSAQQLIQSFSGGAETGFKRVVMIEHPRKGAWSIGFLTGLTKDEEGKALSIVYIPTAPTPNSGWVAVLPSEDVYDTDLTVQSAMKLVLSGGITTPPQIIKRAHNSADDEAVALTEGADEAGDGNG